MKPLPLIAVLLFCSFSARAAIKSEPIAYKEGTTDFEGVLFYDDADTTPRRTVLVCHEWWGLNDYAKQRAEQLAKMGYVAFAVDMYGKGVQAKSMEEAGKMAGALKDNRATLRARINAALAAVKARKEVDPKKIAAIGYCFGGGGVMELARSGADISGIVSFHGGGALATKNPAKPGDVKCKVMIIQAAQDPSTNRAGFDALLDELRDAKVDYQTILYNLNVHPFTVPGGQGYDADADRRSWASMRVFFDEIFGR